MQADLILKEFWEDNDRFADFFNTVYFGGRKVVSPEELESVPEELAYAEKSGKKLKTVKKHRDKVKLWHGTVLVLLGMENQNKVHYAMPERVMLYDALQYEKQRKKIEKEHRRKRDLRNASGTGTVFCRLSDSPVSGIGERWTGF